MKHYDENAMKFEKIKRKPKTTLVEDKKQFKRDKKNSNINKLKEIEYFSKYQEELDKIDFNKMNF